MKIATWNIERLQQKNQLPEILAECERVDADILVFTEADERVKPKGYPYCYATKQPQDHELPPYTGLVHYEDTEKRILIYSKYPCVRKHETFDDTIALCVEFETEKGNLLVYGTIIGIHGQRKPFFMNELNGAMTDMRALTSAGHLVCMLGDYNCSFADSYYTSKEARKIIQDTFAECDIRLLTEKQPECIDHIAISEAFVGDAEVCVEEWNLDKKLSDHKGIAVIL